MIAMEKRKMDTASTDDLENILRHLVKVQDEVKDARESFGIAKSWLDDAKRVVSIAKKRWVRAVELEWQIKVKLEELSRS